MAYTTLRVTEQGVVLYRFHQARFEPAGRDAVAAFQAFCATAAPGSYTVRWRAHALELQPLQASRLTDELPVRLRPSPLAPGAGQIPKPGPEGPYRQVRSDGVATLLTDAEGQELFEACVAAVVAFDGKQLVMPPPDRPRVWSTSEAALRTQWTVRDAPLAAADDAPLLLINAVKGTCAPRLERRPAFPGKLRAALDDFLEQTARRP